MAKDSNGDEIVRVYTNEATDSLYDEVERHEAALGRLTVELVESQQLARAFEDVINTQQILADLDNDRIIALSGELDAERQRHAKRESWTGAALAVAMLLGMFFGTIFGLASR